MDTIMSQKTQLAKLSLVVFLLLITPLLSTTMRPPYVYFLLNLLIIAVGAEAGLLSFLGTPQDDPSVAKPLAVSSSITTPDSKEPSSVVPMKKKPTMEKSVSEKTRTVVKVQVASMKKSPSSPSLFFIGGQDHHEQEEEVLQLSDEHELQQDEEEVLEVEVLSGQELFTKAEMFIGNFYKQLKIQREDSWKKIHGIYH